VYLYGWLGGVFGPSDVLMLSCGRPAGSEIGAGGFMTVHHQCCYKRGLFFQLRCAGCDPTGDGLGHGTVGAAGCSYAYATRGD
jgi:hypothetical protein